MFDQSIDPNDPAVFEVTRRLEAYADLRLSPSAAATTRIRMHVMGAAHRHAALVEADAATLLAARFAAAVTKSREAGARSAWRRLLIAASAAALTLGVAIGTVSAAQPGGPLYGARMWAETAALPGDPMARVGAEVSRLDARLREAQAAAEAGDAAAAQAALDAYAAIADEAEGASAGDPAAIAAIEATVTRHLAILTLLADRVPEAARPAIQHALTSSTKFLDGVNPAGGGATNGNHAGAPTGGTPAGHDGQPTVTAKPDKPSETPDAGKPAATPDVAKPPASDGPSGSPIPSPADGGARSGHDGPQPSK